MANTGDYSAFQVNNTRFPLESPVPNPGGYNSGGGPTPNAIADGAIHYALDFWSFVVEWYVGGSLIQAAANAELTFQKAVLQRYPYEPTPEFLEEQLRLPALFAYRTRSRTEQWTAGWEHDVTNFELVYVLPPLTAAQTELLAPYLPAVAQALRRKTTDAWDPNYAPPGGQLGQQFDSAPFANLQEIGFGEWGNPKRPLSEWYRVGKLPGTGNLWFPALQMTGYLVERDQYYTSLAGPSKFDGADITGNVQAGDGTDVAAASTGIVQASTNPAPTISGLSATSGPYSGGTSVTLTGTGFLAGSAVYFGPASDPQYAPSFAWNGPTSVTVTSPAMQGSGVVDVTIANRDGQLGTLPQSFTLT